MPFRSKNLCPFGLEVEGLSLWQGLDQAAADALADAWSTHGVIVFRRQSLSEPELVEFSNWLGRAEVIVREDWQSGACPEIIKISNMKDSYGRSIGGLGSGELDWHADQSYMVEPATGSILYMVEMPSSPPITYWSNLRLAYQALSEEQKARIDGLEVIYDYLVRQSTYDDEPDMSAELRRKTPRVSHPLVNAHPRSGRRALYLDPTTAAGVVGWTSESSKALLDELVRHATQEQFVYAHQWQIGDVVMWDNGFLMHRRDEFDPAGNRLLKRTTLQLSPERHIVPPGAILS